MPIETGITTADGTKAFGAALGAAMAPGMVADLGWKGAGMTLAKGAAGSYLGDAVGTYGSKALGATEDESQFFGDMGSLVGGTVGGAQGLYKGYKTPKTFKPFHYSDPNPRVLVIEDPYESPFSPRFDPKYTGAWQESGYHGENMVNSNTIQFDGRVWGQTGKTAKIGGIEGVDEYGWVKPSAEFPEGFQLNSSTRFQGKGGAGHKGRADVNYPKAIEELFKKNNIEYKADGLKKYANAFRK